MFYAKNVLQENRIEFLLKINNESKIRRAIKSLMLGKVKMMSYENLVTAWTKRVEKKIISARKTLTRIEKETIEQCKLKSAQRKRREDMMKDDTRRRTIKMSRINDIIVVSNNDTLTEDCVIDVTRYKTSEARIYWYLISILYILQIRKVVKQYKCLIFAARASHWVVSTNYHQINFSYTSMLLSFRNIYDHINL